jgi:hypothetical protein
MPYEVQLGDAAPQPIVSIRARVPIGQLVDFFDEACQEMPAWNGWASAPQDRRCRSGTVLPESARVGRRSRRASPSIGRCHPVGASHGVSCRPANSPPTSTRVPMTAWTPPWTRCGDVDAAPYPRGCRATPRCHPRWPQGHQRSSGLPNRGRLARPVGG